MAETTEIEINSDDWINISNGAEEIRVKNESGNLAIVIRESGTTPPTNESTGETVFANNAVNAILDGTDIYARVPQADPNITLVAKLAVTA